MTDSHPAPTWAHIDAFCSADDWTQDRVTDHYFWEKILPSGDVLHTHRSLSGKPIKPRIFSKILREQLRVSKDDFWMAISTGRPVDRPSEVEEAPPEHPLWVINGLAKFGIRLDQISQMAPDEAIALLWEKRAEPS